MATPNDMQNNTEPDCASPIATVQHLSEGINEWLARKLLGRRKNMIEFILVTREPEHMAKALEIAGRVAKKSRNRLKKTKKKLTTSA